MMYGLLDEIDTSNGPPWRFIASGITEAEQRFPAPRESAVVG